MVRISSTYRGRPYRRSDDENGVSTGADSATYGTAHQPPAVSESDLARARAIRAEVLGAWPSGDTVRNRFVGLVSLNDEPNLGELSAALGMSFTQIGSSALVMDANFHHPSLHTILGCPIQPGLGDVLRDPRKVHEAIYPTAVRGLTVMPSGDPQHRDDQLIEGGALIDLLGGGSLRSMVTVVAICGTRSRSLATTLAGFDAVVPVLRRGGISAREVTGFVDSLKSRAIPLAGFVMNG